MKYIKRKISVFIALSLLGVSTANAELIIEDGITPPKTIVSSNQQGFLNNSSQSLRIASPIYKSKNVSEIGTRVITAPVDGWGDNIELSIVLKQIVPDGWKATNKNGIDLNQKITWKSNNEDWIGVFGKVADDNKIVANVNWNTKIIDLISDSKTVAKPIVVQSNIPVRSTDSSSKLISKPALEKVEQKNVVNKPVFHSSRNTTPVLSTQSKPFVSTGQLWHMSKDKTLRENIQDWAKKEGWTVSWEAPDYKIIASFDLTGRLDAEDGPIAKVVKSYEGSEQPLVARILKGNKVIRVESRNYNQSPVVVTSVSEDYRTAN